MDRDSDPDEEVECGRRREHSQDTGPGPPTLPESRGSRDRTTERAVTVIKK